MVLSIYEKVIGKYFLSMGMLCNVIDGSNINKDTIQFINDVNNFYIFSLLPHILEYKVHNFEFCHA